MQGHLSRRVPAVGLALAFAIVTLSISPAQADNRTFGDPRGDVLHGMDITRVTVHNARPLVVTLQHHNVSERAGAWSGVYIDVDSSPGPTYYIAGSVGGDYQLFWTTRRWRIGGTIGGCNYRQTYSTRTDTTRFTLARACLNGASFRATRVRVSAVAGVSGGRVDWVPAYHRLSAWVPL